MFTKKEIKEIKDILSKAEYHAEQASHFYEIATTTIRELGGVSTSPSKKKQEQLDPRVEAILAKRKRRFNKLLQQSQNL